MSSEQGALRPQPKELNAELRLLYNLIPRYSSADKPDPDRLLVRIFSQRKSSFGQVVQGRLRELVAQAPITPSFRVRIVSKFETYLGVGINADEERGVMREDFPYLEDEDPDNGGIFDPEKAKGLERITFIRHTRVDLSSYLAAKYIHERFLASGEGEGAQIFGRIAAEDIATREQWKREFLEFYGEEIFTL